MRDRNSVLSGGGGGGGGKGREGSAAEGKEHRVFPSEVPVGEEGGQWGEPTKGLPPTLPSR